MDYCSLCGQYHDHHTACPVVITPTPTIMATPSTYHFPARTLTTQEPMETCPTCHGAGLVTSTLRREIGAAIQEINKLFWGVLGAPK